VVDLAGVEVGRAGPQDAPALLELINSIQPHVPWSETHLRWQFFDPPAGPARLYVIRQGEKIVSLYSAIRQRVGVAGHVRNGWMVQDVMTDPAFRGRGFLNYLAGLCLSEISREQDVGYTFPNKQSEGSFRRSGWDELGRVPLRSRSAQPGAGVAAIRDLTRIERFSAAHEKAWADSDLGAGVHRDLDFLRWRYSKPRQTYERYSIGADAGFLILKLYRGEDSTTLHICDLVVQSKARHLVASALEFAFQRAAAASAGIVTAWLPADHPYAGAFDDAGLVLEPEHDRYIFVTGGAITPWHIVQGDSDIY
jgi:hypothetical protein